MDRDTLMIQGKGLSRRYSETLYKKKKVEELGYMVHEMWVCDFKRSTLKFDTYESEENEP